MPARDGNIGKSIARRAIAALLALGLAATAAYAEPLTVSAEPPDADKRAAFNSRWDVFLEGEIDAGAAERVAQELAAIGGDGADVYVDSPGGNLFAGMQIGGLLRRIGATITVGKSGTRTSKIEPGNCFSACSLLFLGGVYRYMPDGSVFGVHRVSTTAAQSERDFDSGQIVSAGIAGYIKEMGVDAGFFDRMVRAGRNQIYVLNAEELRSLRVVNNGRQPAEWSTESSIRGQNLVGAQQTAGGSGKAIFSCHNGVVTLRSLYEAGANAALVAAGQWTHQLLIDDQPLALDPPSAIADANGIVDALFVLSPEQAGRIAAASSVGHAMQGSRNDAASLGYRIDIDAAAAKRVRGFMEFCAASR